MPKKDNKAYDFLCTLKESTAQIVDSALNGFNETRSNIDWAKLDDDQKSAIHGWHQDLRRANESMNGING
tara:strand:+ start:147 stop:356 length:210 start_codon:yes stop_codon:yes gene_type:complete